jgi:K+:H+ antiporter
VLSDASGGYAADAGKASDEISCDGALCGAKGLGEGRSSGRLSRRQARTILNDIAEMASRYNVKIETPRVSSVRPANAIINEAKAGAYDLIVMGVSRRPGERLYFGDTPTAVLAKSPCSLLFLST